MRDRKFYDRVKDALLLPLTDGSFLTVPDYLEGAKDTHPGTVYYASDKAAQSQYISMFDAQGIRVALFDRALDVQFLSMLESYDSTVKYIRIDADVADVLKQDGEAKEDEALISLFQTVSGKADLKVEFSSFKDTSVPALLTVSEDSRRLEEMMRLYAAGGMPVGMEMPEDLTLTLNTASPLISKLSSLDADRQKTVASYLYRLALLSQRKLSAEELSEFLGQGYALLELLV